jgi:hypothetical protein
VKEEEVAMFGGLRESSLTSFDQTKQPVLSPIRLELGQKVVTEATQVVLFNLSIECFAQRIYEPCMFAPFLEKDPQGPRGRVQKHHEL